MRKVLLTGASGFIGRNIAELWENKYQLYCPSSKELDLLDQEMVQEYLEQGHFDVVVHCANRNETRKQIALYDVLDGNLRMFFNLEQCHDLYGKMIYFGSGAEYDRKNYIPNMEEDYLGVHIPKDPYGFSKYIMAETCKKSQNIYELCLFGVYGKYEEWERRFISNAICRGLKGLEITIQKNVYFDYLWIEDLARVLEWFVESETKFYHKRYNVCRGEKIDLYSLGLLVRKILNLDCDIVIKEKGWKPEYTGCNERLIKEIGAFPFITFEKSIRMLCDYYKEHLAEIDEKRLI